MTRILVDVDTQFDFVDEAGALHVPAGPGVRSSIARHLNAAVAACVDAAVHGLLERGYRVRVLAEATAAIGGPAGAASSRASLVALGAEWVGGVDA